MNKKKKLYVGLLFKAFLTIILMFPQHRMIAGNSLELLPKQPEQTKTIVKGIVKDDTDEPLIGATVMVKGTNEGTVTDVDGAFALTTDAMNPVIIVSYIGYETQEINVSGRTFLNVKMSISSSVSIQEVVVTAMGILRKEKSLTYATQQVKSDDLMKVQDVNVANSLEGKIAGIVITPSAGGAGGASKIQLRGTKSIIGSSSPLIVVDGVPMSNETRGQINDATAMTEGNAAEGADPLSMINPDDIESMNVLKGANAAALYGSRAANGVIMITTKKGKAGKMAVSYTGNVTFESPLLLPKIQNTYGAAVDAQGYLGEANGWGGRITESPLTARSRVTDKIPYEREIHLRNQSNDDVADFYRTGITANNSVAVSGGTEKIQTYVSFANSHALGLVETNCYNRNTFAFRQTYKLWDRITLNASINYVQTKTNNRIGGGTVANPIYHLYTAPRNIDMEYYRENYVIPEGHWLSDPQGHYVQTDNGFIRQNDVAELKGPMMNYAYLDARQNNPYWLLKQNWGTHYNDRVYGGFQGMVDIFKGLTFQARFNFDHDKYREVGGRYASTFAPASMYDYGTYNKGRNSTTEMYLDFLLSYNKDVSEDWSVSASAGWVGHVTKTESYQTYIANATYVDPLNQQISTLVNCFNTSYGSSGITSESEGSNWDRGLLATAQVGWKEKVYLDASFRTDAYKVYRQFNNGKDKFYPYFGFGANALVSELVKLPVWWDYAKFRISYSQVGNAVPNRYYNSAIQKARTGAITATSGTLFESAKPETTMSFETGLELLFFDSRLSLDLTYYSATVKDLYLPIVNTAGLTVYENSAKVRNQGFESTLGYNFRFGKELRWRTALNFAYNFNKILAVGYDEAGRKKQIFKDVAGVRVRYFEGDSFGDMYVRDLRRNDDGTIFMSTNGNIMKQQRYTKYVGNMNSKYQLGWTNTLNYKEFQLSFLVNGRIGGKVISLTEATLDEMGLSERTAEARDYAVANGLYTDTGEAAMYLPDGSGRIIGVRNYYQVMGARNSQYSPLYVYDATNFRLRELSLAYTFKNLLGEGKNISVSFIGRNLFFLYKKAPVDPDVSISTGNGLGGFEFFNMPSTRSYGFNVKMNF